MKIASLTSDTVTFTTEPQEHAELGRLFGRFPQYEYSFHWTGPRTSGWWMEWNNASPGTDRRPRWQPGAILEVTEDHLKLLRRMYLDWQSCEFGAPEVDPKRPYGNSSVHTDIAEIIGIPMPDDEDDDFPKEAIVRMNRLHRETQWCIDILLRHASLTPGRYRNDASSKCSRPSWVRLAD